MPVGDVISLATLPRGTMGDRSTHSLAEHQAKFIFLSICTLPSALALVA